MTKEYVKTSVNLETALYERIEDLVKERNCTRTDIIVESLEAHLAQKGESPHKYRSDKEVLIQVLLLCGNRTCFECSFHDTCEKYLKDKSLAIFVAEALKEISSVNGGVEE